MIFVMWCCWFVIVVFRLTDLWSDNLLPSVVVRRLSVCPSVCLSVRLSVCHRAYLETPCADRSEIRTGSEMA